MTTYARSGEDLIEVSLLSARHTMNIPANIGDQTDTVAHGLGLVPFFDYIISVDVGTTFINPHRDYINFPETYIQMYSDETNIYFNYTFDTLPPTHPTKIVIIEYRLFVVEARR